MCILENFKKYLFNIAYIIKNCFKWETKNTIIGFLYIPVSIILPILHAYIPKIVVNIVTKPISTKTTVTSLIIFSLSIAIFSWLESVVTNKLSALQKNVGTHYSSLVLEKLLYMDYSNLENYDNRLHLERIKQFAFGGMSSPGSDVIWYILNLCTSIFGITTFFVLLKNLNLIMLIAIIIICIIECIIYYGICKATILLEDTLSPLQMQLSYFFRTSLDTKAAKDIRLTNAKDWLLFLIAKTSASLINALKVYVHRYTQLSFSQAICVLIREILIFSFLITMVLKDKNDIGDFLLYFGLLTSFSGWINEISWQLIRCKFSAIECQKFREFLNIKNKEIGSSFLPSKFNVNEITFENVSFSYDGKTDILSNLNFSIKSGESIAIVGENGCGKTTLIKLLCGLYSPTSGKILINGIDIKSLNKQNYFDLFGIIFQDYFLLPTSIQKNITGEQELDENRYEKLIEQVGLTNTINKLNMGSNATFGKQLFDESVELSGGEQQKLLLVRALYKNPSIIVLDEPTSGLDPIAEERLYEQYNELLTKKISIFITHRLSSTKFCNRIFFLKDGKISESGTHNELIEKGKDYSYMYGVQSELYL